MTTIDQVRAYFRLQRMKDKENDLNIFANDVVKALGKYDDLDKAKVLDLINMKIEREMAIKKELAEQTFLRTEKAHDIIKLTLI